jgi:hypothetical protein
MDQTALVDHLIDDGERLLQALKQDQFDIMAAFWLYTSEDELWHLYLVVDGVEAKGTRDAYGRVFKVMRQLQQPLWVESTDVKIVGPSEPIAKAVLDYLAHQTVNLRTWFRRTRLGGVAIDSALVYPPMAADKVS